MVLFRSYTDLKVWDARLNTSEVRVLALSYLSLKLGYFHSVSVAVES